MFTASQEQDRNTQLRKILSAFILHPILHAWCHSMVNRPVTVGMIDSCHWDSEGCRNLWKVWSQIVTPPCRKWQHLSILKHSDTTCPVQMFACGFIKRITAHTTYFSCFTHLLHLSLHQLLKSFHAVSSYSPAKINLMLIIQVKKHINTLSLVISAVTVQPQQTQCKTQRCLYAKCVKWFLSVKNCEI